MITLRDWLREGPYTLALSSSFFGFFAHCGFVAALEELDSPASRYSGSSAGAMVGAGLASGISAAAMRELFFSVSREDFWDPAPGLGFLRGRKFQGLLEEHFVADFSETKAPVSVTAFDLLACRTRFLDRGSLPKAVAASCAVPLFFQPVWIEGRPYIDGGVFHKSGIPAGAERVLCVFFESEGWTGAYERRSTFPKLAPGHKILRYQGLPKVDFYSLRGRENAFQEAFRRSKAAFGKVLRSSILEA